MASVLNKITKQYIQYANTPDYDLSEWIINPDISAVIDYQTIFWNINSDDTISLMNTTDQQQVILLLPYSGMSASDAIKYRCSLLTQTAQNIINAGYPYNDGNTYNSDIVSRINLSGITDAMANGYVLPSNFVWRNIVNTNIPFTSTEILNLGISMMGWVNAVYQVSWNYKAILLEMTSNTVLEIAQYDCTQNWPSNTTYNSTQTITI